MRKPDMYTANDNLQISTVLIENLITVQRHKRERYMPVSETPLGFSNWSAFSGI
jgi:hypothetical protein